MEDILSTVNNLCEKAIQYGQSFSKNLDFSEESLKDVEEILDYYNNKFKDKFINNTNVDTKEQEAMESQIWNLACIFGVYVGEVMCRNNESRCNWVYEDGFGTGVSLHIKVDNNNRACPLDKAYKRLKNDSGDNVVSFYNIFKDLVLTGKLSQKKV